MTDKTVPTPGEKEEAALEEKELKVADIVKLSKGRGIMDDMQLYMLLHSWKCTA